MCKYVYNIDRNINMMEGDGVYIYIIWQWLNQGETLNHFGIANW